MGGEPRRHARRRHSAADRQGARRRRCAWGAMFTCCSAAERPLKPARRPSRRGPTRCCWQGACRKPATSSHSSGSVGHRPFSSRARTWDAASRGPGAILDGSLCGYAADLAVDPIYQRVLAHQPVLDDAAREVVTLLNCPAVAVIDMQALPASFGEPWRTGQVDETGRPGRRRPSTLPSNWQSSPSPSLIARIVGAWAAACAMRRAFAVADRLAAALGGAVAGDVGARRGLD